MTNKERILAVLNYESYDRLPIVHFGYWVDTVVKWVNEGYISQDEFDEWKSKNQLEKKVSDKLGFDFGWNATCYVRASLFPSFEREILEEYPDGSRKVRDAYGAIILEKEDTVSIPKEIDHTLKDRKSWEEYYIPKLQYSSERAAILPDDLDENDPKILFCGSLYGELRNICGVENLSYMQIDYPDLYDEMIDTLCSLAVKSVEDTLKKGYKFDIGHFWEDICFNYGPLVNPKVFDEKIGPYYKKITDLLKASGCNLVSLDCDGKIDELIPIWLSNGVNIMFPIEVGTWNASIEPWRKQYGKKIRGVGGMNKNLFAKDYSAIDEEIERLKRLVDLGGYIPCPDHRIPPEAKWENVQYYTNKMKEVFGG